VPHISGGSERSTRLWYLRAGLTTNSQIVCANLKNLLESQPVESTVVSPRKNQVQIGALPSMNFAYRAIALISSGWTYKAL
jgi:hypothetical protein